VGATTITVRCLWLVTDVTVPDIPPRSTCSPSRPYAIPDIIAGMSEWHSIIAGPSFEGLDRMIWTCSAIFAVWASAAIYATLRLSKIREHERPGLLFWLAAIIAVGGLLYTVGFMILHRLQDSFFK
jgi:hypothetical protein